MLYNRTVFISWCWNAVWQVLDYAHTTLDFLFEYGAASQWSCIMYMYVRVCVCLRILWSLTVLQFHMKTLHCMQSVNVFDRTMRTAIAFYDPVFINKRCTTPKKWFGCIICTLFRHITFLSVFLLLFVITFCVPQFTIQTQLVKVSVMHKLSDIILSTISQQILWMFKQVFIVLPSNEIILCEWNVQNILRHNFMVAFGVSLLNYPWLNVSRSPIRFLFFFFSFF